MSRIFAAMYFTSPASSSLPTPSSTTRPRAISPDRRSPTRTRASVTRWTTARTSVLDLNEIRLQALVLEAKRHAVAQLAARIEARVEQMARHDVAERLQHRLLDAG